MKKQSQKNRPARGAKNTDRASIILNLFREFPNNKFSLKHLASASGGATKEGRRETFEILGRLHDEGIVEECAREKYRLTHKHLPHYEGVADMTAGGSIYVRVEGEENDIFVNQRNTANALNGDRVEVVVMHRSREVSYYLESSPLSVEELQTVIDAVNTSPFIPVRKANDLKKKLSLLTSEKSARMLDRPVFFPDRRKGEKEPSYQKTELVRKAIRLDRRIAFDYTEPDTEDWFENRFYIVAGSDDFAEGLRPLAVRGMTNTAILSSPREKLFVYSGDVDFNMQQYVNGVFSADAETEPFQY